MSTTRTPGALERIIREYLAVRSDLMLSGPALDNMALELARIAHEPHGTPAAHAVAHLLKRIKADPRLAWLIGPCSESFELLMVAGAAVGGYDIDAYRDTFQAGLKTQPLPGIGKEYVVIDTEHLVRMSLINDGVLDLEELVNHFIGLGLEAEEARRGDRTGELF